MEEVADRLSMYATYFDRPELINEQLGRYLAVDAEAIRAVVRAGLRTRTPGPSSRTCPAARPPHEREAATRHRDRPGSPCSTGGPSPGAPRAYHFPAFRRARGSTNGLEVILAHVPGRPLLPAQLIVRGEAGGGASSEAADQAGVTVLTARAHDRGHRSSATRVELRRGGRAPRRRARRGRGLGQPVGAHVEVPRTRLAPALALLAEMALEPELPGARGASASATSASTT